MNTLIRYALCGVFTLYTTAVLAEHGKAISAPDSSADTPVRTLSIDQLIDNVLTSNAGLAALRAAVESDLARSAYADDLPDPQLSTAFAPSTLGGFESASGRDRGTNIKLEISQSLPWPGKLKLRADAARAEVDVALQSVSAMQLKLADLAHQAYAEWVYVHEALRINADHQSLVDELRSVAETRYAAGLVGQQDVLQAEVQLQHLRHRQIRLQRIRRSVRARINALLNRSANQPVGNPDPFPALPALSDYTVLREQALKQHPELLRLERQINANQYRESLAEKDFYPDFNVFSGYNSLWDEPDKRWVVGAGINLPFNRDKYRNRLDETRARTQQLRYTLTDQRAQLLSELDQAHAMAVEADHSLALYRDEIVPLAGESLSAARAEYGSGGGSFLDVITAEQLRLQAELEQARAQADVHIAHAAVRRWSASHAHPGPSARAISYSPETNRE